MGGDAVVNTARVLVNRACNHNCAFCIDRRPVEDPAVTDLAAVRARIDAALREGAREVVLTGGEPTLRAELPLIVRYAKRAGAATVTLETNGAPVHPRLAAALAASGLDVARVHLPAWGDAADAISRDPGGFRAARAGMAALVEAGVTVEVGAPIVAANLDTIAALPEHVRDAGARALVLFVPVEAPDEGTLVPLADAARAIEAVDAAARTVGLAVRLDPATLIPPCLAARPSRIAHLYALTRGGAAREGYRRLSPCEGCAVRDRCPGVPEAALARETPVLRPIADDRARRRLSIISSVEDQVARELVTLERRSISGSRFDEAIVRVNFHCNQACTFCFVSTHLPPADEAAIEQAIVDIARAGGTLTLSGGEPTLNPRLTDYVRLGRREGARRITLQTNAMRLADPDLVAALVDAGLDHVFISLHGSTAVIGDRVTEAPGTWEKQVQGIDVVARAPVECRLNFVFCGANFADFPGYVDLVARRWPGVSVNVSFVAPSTDVVPRDRALIPRYTDVRPHLEEGMRRARASGLLLTGFESMCGLPLCCVPAEARDAVDARIGQGADRGEFLKTDACRACSVEERCWGLRRGYAELHGSDELVPV